MERKIRIEKHTISRLEDLYSRIQTNGIGFDRFEFHSDFIGKDEKGTFGCIIGALPYLYPDIFETKYNVRIACYIQTPIDKTVCSDFCSYFGMSDIVGHLFVPGAQIKYINSRQMKVNDTLEVAMENLKLTIDYLKSNESILSINKYN